MLAHPIMPPHFFMPCLQSSDGASSSLQEAVGSVCEWPVAVSSSAPVAGLLAARGDREQLRQTTQDNAPLSDFGWALLHGQAQKGPDSEAHPPPYDPEPPNSTTPPLSDFSKAFKAAMMDFSKG